MNNVYIEISGLSDEQLRQKKPTKEVSEIRQLMWTMMVSQGERVCDICREFDFHRSTIEYAINKYKNRDILLVDKIFDKKRRAFLSKQ